MIQIIKKPNSADIYYTKDDTFKITVGSNGEFEEGSSLKFIIAKNEEENPLVEEIFQLNENVFDITLNNPNKDKLAIGEYIYKIVLTNSSGEVVTQVSGNFIVKWGA